MEEKKKGGMPLLLPPHHQLVGWIGWVAVAGRTNLRCGGWILTVAASGTPDGFLMGPLLAGIGWMA